MPLETSLSHSLKTHLREARHVILVAGPVGIVVGLAIAGYDYIVNTLLWDHFSIHLSPFHQALLPVAGMLLTGAILSIFRVASSSMADEVVLAYHQPKKGIHYKTAIPKLIASIATMGFGGSAGMEGASKWLGGTIASFVQIRLNRSKSLKWFHGKVETTLMAGAAAGIGAIFRAPLTGAIMGIESPYKKDLAHEALIHGLVASALSYATFITLRSSTPYFPIHFVYRIHARDLALCLVVGLLAGAASHLFLGTLQIIRKRWSRWSSPLAYKYALGGLLVSSVALASYHWIGEPATLQAGLPVANRLLNGQYALNVCLFIFFAKLLATAITFGMGGVGGLFVPSATIGAALGAVCDIVLKPSQPGLFTLVGVAAFTGASYNSLLFAAVFIAEATGSPALVVPGLLASSMAFLVSSGISNSGSQREKRFSDENRLAFIPCRDWMTTKIVVAKPTESLGEFFGRAMLDHHFRALPVVNEKGTFLGLAAMKSLKDFPRDKWDHATIAEIMDTRARTVCPTHSMASVEKELSRGRQDYIPVIHPLSDQLLGILSSSDVHRARQNQKKETHHERPEVPNAVRPPNLSQAGGQQEGSTVVGPSV